jgi:Type I restriction enzyme R protein N terminus (HSDR_N)
MPAIPSKVATRLTTQLKRFQGILASAKSRDVNESDTGILVTDVLADLFGYDKYTEITSEYAIRSTYCDLAIKIDGTLQLLIEVKAIGIELRDAHARQAVDYAANQGVEWVVLTNGIVWKAYRVAFTKPIGQDLVLEVDLLNLNPRTAADLNLLYLLCREGIVKSLLPEYYLHRQATSRFALGAIVLSEPMLEVVRRELRRLNPGVRVDLEEIKTVLMQEVIKREVMEGEAAEEARRRVRRSISRALRTRQPRGVDEEPESLTPASQTAERSDLAPEAAHP